jgi:hypothetical protein
MLATRNVRCAAIQAKLELSLRRQREVACFVSSVKERIFISDESNTSKLARGEKLPQRKPTIDNKR